MKWWCKCLFLNVLDELFAGNSPHGPADYDLVAGGQAFAVADAAVVPSDLGQSPFEDPTAG